MKEVYLQLENVDWLEECVASEHLGESVFSPCVEIQGLSGGIACGANGGI